MQASIVNSVLHEQLDCKTNNFNQIRRILYCQHSCCYENGKLENRGWADPGAALAELGGPSVEKWYA